jgi:hypothetical protein
MFENPSSGGGTFIEDGRYLVKVKRLEPVEDNGFGPGVKWVFNLATTDGELVKDERGFDAELWQFSSRKMSKGAKTAKARAWAEALLGRELSDDETGDGLAELLIGKKALALIGQNEKERSTILKMTPIAAKNGQATAAPAPATAPAKGGSAPPDEIPDKVLASVVDTEEF